MDEDSTSAGGSRGRRPRLQRFNNRGRRHGSTASTLQRFNELRTDGGRGCCLRLYVSVEDRQPGALLLLPNRTGVIGTGSVLSIVCPLNHNLVGRYNYVRFIRESIV